MVREGDGSLPEIPRRVRWAVFLRSLLIQGSWNYRTLIGTGLAFALLPVLRFAHRGDPEAFREAVRRHAGLFNAHPYLVGVALGAVTALEVEGASPELVDRFKAAVRGPLGSLGDRLVWAGWLPTCSLGALVLYFAGAPVWVAVGGFVVLYNAGHLTLRGWAFGLGYGEGKKVGDRLRSTGISRGADRLGRVSVFLAGVLLPLVLLRGPEGVEPSPLWGVLGAGGAALGMWLGDRVKNRATLLLLVAVVAVLAYGSIR